MIVAADNSFIADPFLCGNYDLQNGGGSQPFSLLPHTTTTPPLSLIPDSAVVPSPALGLGLKFAFGYRKS